MAYEIDFNQKGNYKLHTRKFFLKPSLWIDSSNQYTFNLKWKRIKFNRKNFSILPNKKGIYCFVVVPKFQHFFETRYLFYVGKTTRTLKKRYNEYLQDQAGKGKPRPKVFEMLNLYKENLYFYYSVVNINTDIDVIEKKLLNIFVPHINTDIPNAKIKPEFKNLYE